MKRLIRNGLKAATAILVMIARATPEMLYALAGLSFYEGHVIKGFWLSLATIVAYAIKGRATHRGHKKE